MEERNCVRPSRISPEENQSFLMFLGLQRQISVKNRLMKSLKMTTLDKPDTYFNENVTKVNHTKILYYK